MATLGYRPASNPGSSRRINISIDDQVGQRQSSGMPEHGWLVSCGFRGHRTGANVTAYPALWRESDEALLSAPGSVSVASSTSAEYLVNLTTPVLLASGVRYVPGLLATGDDLEVAEHPSQSGTLWFRNQNNPPPRDPFGVTNVDENEDRLALFAVYDPNVAPGTPTGLAPTGTVESLAPTFNATFADANQTKSTGGSNAAEKLKAYRFELRQQGQTTLLWQATYTADGAEQAANQVQRPYGGSALTRGVTYEWRVGVADQADAWSAWTAWQTVTIASLGFVTLDGTPTGKQDVNTGLDFQGRWHHVNGVAAEAVEIRLRQAGSIIATTEVAKSVASAALPGTLFTVTWAESAFPTLAWGSSYTYELRGRDTNDEWSSWSAQRSFTTNAVPGTPSGLSPSGGVVLGFRPLLKASASDADDTPATGLTVKARIKDDAGAVLFTPTMTPVGATWEHQTTSAELADFATYRWDAYSFDGTLYSGATTVEADAAKSAEASFVYAAVPTPAVTAPAHDSTIATNTPTVQWTSGVAGPATQTHFRVTVIEIVGSAPFPVAYDSGWVAGSGTSHAVPSGPLHDDTVYHFYVSVRDSNALEGISDFNFVTLDFPTPAALPLMASPFHASFDPAAYPSVVLLSWSETEVPSGEFEYYGLHRDGVLVKKITSPTQTTWVDETPPHGDARVWTLRQYVTAGTDLLEGAPSEAQAAVLLGGSVLSDVADGLARRAVLSRIDERTHRPERDRVVVPTWALDGKPAVEEGPLGYEALEVAARIVAGDEGSAEAQLAAIRALAGYRADRSPIVVCHRDERARKGFYRLIDDPVEDARLGRYAVRLRLVEVAHTESVG